MANQEKTIKNNIQTPGTWVGEWPTCQLHCPKKMGSQGKNPLTPHDTSKKLMALQQQELNNHI